MITIKNNEKDQVENEKLEKLLSDINSISEIQSDIDNIIQSQHENLNLIDKNVEHSLEEIEISNNHLEKAYQNKTILKPIIIGTSLGILSTLPITIPICISTSISTSLIGYSCLGGGMVGGIIGRKLA